MTVDKMTPEQKNHFWTLLIGEKWHEVTMEKEDIWGDGLPSYRCSCISNPNYFVDPNRHKSIDFYASLSGFQRVKDFMEKEMPEVWESYIEYYFTPRTRSYRDTISEILSLDNLLSFLLSNTDAWGWRECPECKGTKQNLSISPTAEKPYPFVCSPCNGTGKIKHPALVWLEKEES